MGPEVLREVDDALRYTLDEHSGPEPGVLASERFETLVRRLLVGLEQAIAPATLWHGVRCQPNTIQRIQSIGISLTLSQAHRAGSFSSVAVVTRCIGRLAGRSRRLAPPDLGRLGEPRRRERMRRSGLEE